MNEASAPEPSAVPGNRSLAADLERAAQAADAAPVMIWVAAADQRFEWFNRACELFSGLDAAQLMGGGWMSRLHPDDLERHRGILAASYEAQCPFSLDYRLRRHDGQYRWVLDSAVPRFDGAGAFAGYAGSVVDIHERKVAEERLAERTQALRLADRDQAAFVALLSHELRNPLAPIANAASVLRTVEDGNPLLTRLREILERQVGRLGRLLDDLIEATRPAQPQVALGTEPIEVAALVETAVEAARPALERGGHTLDVRLPATPLLVRGDMSRLAQALGSLLDNAAKFSPEPDTLVLEVTSAGHRVEIAVVDRGMGIDPAFLPRIFELFAKRDDSPGRVSTGIGVSLTLARRIAHLHGGGVGANSAGVDRGSRFVLWLPLAAAAGSPEPPAATLPLSESYRVLIVDADPASRESLRQQMTLWGNDVCTADGGEESLRAATVFKPHIVLCDAGLRAPGGAELLARLRQAFPSDSTAVAGVVAQDHPDGEALALELGFDFVLVKPLQPSSFVRGLRAHASGAYAA